MFMVREGERERVKVHLRKLLKHGVGIDMTNAALAKRRRTIGSTAGSLARAALTDKR